LPQHNVSDKVRVSQYHVSVPQFDGPLDLLLQVIERNKLDITHVSLALVADQYLDHIRGSDKVDTDQLAEFVVIGAKLLLIKSRALLPREKQVALDADDEIAVDLTRRLRVYEAFRQAAAWLRSREESRLQSYPRSHRTADLATAPVALGLGETTLPMLQVAYQQAISRQRPAPRTGEVVREIWTVRSALRWLAGALDGGRQSFLSLGSAFRRPRLVASFLALLEATRIGLVRAEQSEPYGDISVELVMRGEELATRLAAIERDGAITPRSGEGPGRSALREDGQGSAEASV
jgi:segregation and condensation protein A